MLSGTHAVLVWATVASRVQTGHQLLLEDAKAFRQLTFASRSKSEMWPIGHSDFHCNPTEIINFIATGTRRRWMSCLFSRVSSPGSVDYSISRSVHHFGQDWIAAALLFRYFSLRLNTKWHKGWKVQSGMLLLVQWHTSKSCCSRLVCCCYSTNTSHFPVAGAAWCCLTTGCHFSMHIERCVTLQ